MKILFLGTPAFATPTLELIAQARHAIVAVLTQPDRPGSRGMRLTPPPVKTAALKLGLNVMQPEKASSPGTLEELRKLAPDAAVVAAYGQILKRAFLSLPRLGCINLHPSLLPKYRGPTPIQSAIMAGDRITGVTTMLLDEGMDTGDILLQREVEITENDTAGTLHDKLAQVGADLVVATLDGLETGRIIPHPQDNAKSTLTRKIGKEDTVINWRQPPKKLYDFIRALDPLPGSQAAFMGETLKIWRVAPVDEYKKRGGPGQVLTADGDNLIVQAGDGAVRILELQRPGGRRMSAAEFMRGYKIKEGMVFGK